MQFAKNGASSLSRQVVFMLVSTATHAKTWCGELLL